MISASIFVGGELEGEDSGVYVVDKDQSGSATSDFTPLTWENGMAQFKQMQYFICQHPLTKDLSKTLVQTSRIHGLR